MTNPNDPKSSDRKPKPDLEAAEARRIILARRAQYVALAMMAAGAATNACGGDVDENQNPATGGASSTATMHACLSMATGGTSATDTTPCLSLALGGDTNTGSRTTKLSPCLGAGGSGATGSSMTPCLKIAAGGSSGGMTPCLDIALPTGGQSTSTSINTGAIGPCLSIAPAGGRSSSATTRLGPCLKGGMSAVGGSVAGGTSAKTSLQGDGGVGKGGMGPCLSPPHT